MRILIFIIIFSSISLTIRASEFKMNQSALETKFSNACEVPFDALVGSLTDSIQNASLFSNRNFVGFSAILFGTIGLHRFLLGHTASGMTHIKLTVLSLVMMLGGGIVAIIASDQRLDDIATAAYVCFLAGFGTLVLHAVYTGVEGLIYLFTPDSKFNKKGGLREDESYYAPFKRHMNK